MHLTRPINVDQNKRREKRLTVLYFAQLSRMTDNLTRAAIQNGFVEIHDLSVLNTRWVLTS
jgi:hypothetical protein